MANRRCVYQRLHTLISDNGARPERPSGRQKGGNRAHLYPDGPAFSSRNYPENGPVATSDATIRIAPERTLSTDGSH